MVSHQDTFNDAFPHDLGVQFLRVGLGSDRSFRLDVTEEQWTRFDLRRQLARYAQFLSTALQQARVRPVEDQGAGEFTFTLGQGATLKFPLAERLDVRVGGKRVGGFERPPITSSLSQAPASDPTTATSACGMAVFDDVERVEAHEARVLPDGPLALGGRARAWIEPARADAGAPHGVVFWRYTLPEDAMGQLAEDERVEEAFTLTDPHRIALRFRLRVTTHRQADGMAVTAVLEEAVAPQEGCVRYSLSGMLEPLEGVLLGQQAVRVRPGRGNPLGGRLSVAIRHDDGGSRAWWSYSLPGRLLLRLGRGQTQEEQFILCLGADCSGTPVLRQLTIAITGEEGAPSIRLVSVDIPELSHPAGCVLMPHAAALVSLTRTLWLSQPGLMLVSAPPRPATAGAVRRAGVRMSSRDYLRVEPPRPAA